VREERVRTTFFTIHPVVQSINDDDGEEDDDYNVMVACTSFTP